MDSHTDVYLNISKENDRYIVLYTLLKLGLISGKVLIYTNTVETGYKVKLFLEEFHMHSLLLNYEHPKSTRHLAVSNFVNKNINYLIVVDPDEKQSQNKGTERVKVFKTAVSVLINFDFPSRTKLYRKRVEDLNAECNNNMSILSLVLPEDHKRLHKLNSRNQKKGTPQLEELNLRMGEFERFRYRCEDILRSITEKTVHSERMNDVKKALLGSKNLKNQLESNPQDKQILKEAKKKKKPPRHLASVPEYLLPEKLRTQPKSVAKYNKKDFETKLARREKRLPKDYLPTETIEETPEQIHWKDLPPVSNRKYWKIKHHFAINKSPSKKRKLK